MCDFPHVPVHYFKMRITSAGYIFVYRWHRLAARLKWLWQDFDHTPTHSRWENGESAHTRFSTLIEWMEMNEWGISLTPIHIHIHMNIRIHVHGCSFLIAALGCALHLYLNVFKRPTIWEHRRCQGQSSVVRTPNPTPPHLQSGQGAGKDPGRRRIRLQLQSHLFAPCSALAFSGVFGPAARAEIKVNMWHWLRLGGFILAGLRLSDSLVFRCKCVLA